jgi:phosphate transport system substrate-binding protein
MKMFRKLILVLTITLFSFTSYSFADNIVMKGSTTVLPIAQPTAERFMEKNSDVSISVQGGGSGVGCAAIVDGTTDIGNSSRPIKDQEIKQALERGARPVPHVVAMDGIAVVVHNSNLVNNLTKDQVKAIYTGGISCWSEVGGRRGQIVVISRDVASGTFEAFNKLALEKERVRPDAQLTASNNASKANVSNTPGGIAYVGLGYVDSSVKAITIDGVVCSKDTVLSGEYPYSRPLYMYTNGEPTGRVKEYIDFVLSKEGQRIVEAQGFVGLD